MEFEERRGRGRPPGSVAFRQRLQALQEQEDHQLAQERANNEVQDDENEILLERMRPVWEGRRRQVEMSRQDSSQSLSLVNDADDIEGSSSSTSVLSIGAALQQRLAELAQRSISSTDACKAEEKNLLEHLYRKNRHVSSLSSESQNLNSDRNHLRLVLQHAAAFLVLFSGYLVGVVLARIKMMANTHEALLLVVRRKYDETPSKIAVSFQDGENGSVQDASGGKAKVLQTKLDVAMVLKETASGKFLQLCFTCPTWLQCLDRTTAETTAAAQEAILSSLASLKESSQMFKLVVHHVVTDKYAANLKAEYVLSSRLTKGITSHVTCDIHKVATIQARTLRFVDPHISAMIGGALAMGESGCLLVLRKCLASVLEDKLQVVYGEPPNDEHTLKFRQAILDAFLPLPKGTWSDVMRSKTKKRIYQMRFIINFFLNGDLQDVMPNMFV